MKRKRLDRDIWTSITEKRYIQKSIRPDGDYVIDDMDELEALSWFNPRQSNN